MQNYFINLVFYLLFLLKIYR